MRCPTRNQNPACEGKGEVDVPRLGKLCRSCSKLWAMTRIERAQRTKNEAYEVLRAATG